jgi:hypothetical protein
MASIDSSLCQLLHLHCTANELYRKFKTNIPRNETVRPRSQFSHSCNLGIYILPRLGPQTHYSKISGPIVGIYKSLIGDSNVEIRNVAEGAQFHLWEYLFQFSVQFDLKIQFLNLPRNGVKKKKLRTRKLV